MLDDLPALLGGKPIRPEGPPAWPFPDPHVSAAIHAALADGSWGEYLGPHVPRLETALAETFGVAHAVACASGTLAVETALHAAGVEPGDEVILGAYDYEPNLLSVHAVGAMPVLVDIGEGNACLDPELLEAAIGPSTKAILATHLHGGLVSMSRVNAIAAKHGIRVIEDAAQVSGAIVEGRPAGSWGDLGVLSFGGSKLLTAGRGGAVLTRHADLFQRARLFLSRGIQQWATLSQLQAAALMPQLQRLAERTRHRHHSVTILVEMLSDVPGLCAFVPSAEETKSRRGDHTLPPALESTENVGGNQCGTTLRVVTLTTRSVVSHSRTAAYFKLGFFLDEAAFGLSRDLFVKALRTEGIAFDPGFRALHVGRAVGRYKAAGPLNRAEIAGRTVVGLHHPVLSLGPAEIEQVAAAIRKTYRNAARLR